MKNEISLYKVKVIVLLIILFAVLIGIILWTSYFLNRTRYGSDYSTLESESEEDITALKADMTNMLSMMKTMLVLIIVIAVLLGAIIIYNLGILSYTEKQYQFATLKVLGFKDKNIKKIFIKQNNWIAIVSIILGLPAGYYVTDWLFKTAIEEHYDFGASITIRTYIIASIGTFVVSYIVSRCLARKVSNIDMVSSLKGNE